MRLHHLHDCPPALSVCFADTVCCPHCRERMVAPELTEFVDACEIRHHWLCDTCGHGFCTTLSLEELTRE